MAERLKNPEMAILGANGFVGSELVKLCQIEGVHVISADRSQVDIRHEESIEAFMKAHPGAVIINCIADTRVDAAEAEREQGENGLSMQINGLGMRRLANIVKQYDGYLVALGSDFEFLGLADDPGPYKEKQRPRYAPFMSVYGGAKLRGFLEFFESGVWGAYIRIAFPYSDGKSPKDFARKVVNLLEAKKPFVRNQNITPTRVGDLFELIKWLKENKPAPRVYHVASPKVTTWAECAEFVAKLTGYQGEVKTTTHEELAKILPAYRPPYGGLDSQETQDITKVMMHAWDEGLTEVFMWNAQLLAQRD